MLGRKLGALLMEVVDMLAVERRCRVGISTMP